MITQYGPIQLVVISFGNNDSFDVEIALELFRVSQDGQGTIRLIDVLFLRHNSHGELSYIEATDLSEREMLEFGSIIGKLIGLGAEVAAGPEVSEMLGPLSVAENDFGLSEEQIYAITEGIPKGSAALILLFEHTWAKSLKAAINRAGGVMLAQGLISPEALLKVGLELAAAVKAAAARETKASGKHAKI